MCRLNCQYSESVCLSARFEATDLERVGSRMYVVSTSVSLYVEMPSDCQLTGAFYSVCQANLSVLRFSFF